MRFEMNNRRAFQLAALLCVLSAGRLSADTGAKIAVSGGTEAVEAVAAFEPEVKLFTDRTYAMAECPEMLRGKKFLRVGIDGCRIRVAADGSLLVITQESNEHGTARGEELEALGFARVEQPAFFQLFGDQPVHRARIYEKRVKAGERYQLRKLGLVAGFEDARIDAPEPWPENTGELLYNGVRLPAVWPPERFRVESVEPMPVPYLDHPPKVIPIDVGRQLLVDDFLVENTDLNRTFHRAQKFAGNPVFKPETNDEVARGGTVYLGHGGVFFDPADKLFKMFYTAGWRGPLALATSRNMICWERPELGISGSNGILPAGAQWTGPELQTAGTDNSLWLDASAADPAERIKYLTCWMHVAGGQRPRGFNHSLQTSADGRRWSAAVPTGLAEDYCSFFYNPFRRVWVYSIKQGGPRGRCRYYAEHADFMRGADFSPSVYWTNADRLDEPEPEGRYPGAGEAPQLYSLNAVAYESLLIGMHYIHRGPNNAVCAKGGFPKLTDLELGFSRDGFHWHRPDRSGFIAGTRRDGDWDRAYLHGTTGVFVLLDDQLVFPYTAFSGIAPDGSRGMYHGGSIGIATLRRDGFASLDADARGGTLTTRPVTFSGRHLFVNVDCPQGELRAEILDADGKLIEPYASARSEAVSVDNTRQRIEWSGADDLASLAGKPVRFRFHLTNGRLYAFWASRDESGRSDGYLAAGGPGYAGPTDTVGVSDEKPAFFDADNRFRF
jgi:hypothetical protein